MPARPRKLTPTEAAEWARFAERIAPLPGKAVGLPSGNPAGLPPGKAVGLPPGNPAATLARPGSQPASPPRVAFVAPASQPASLGVGGRPAGVDTASWRRFRRGHLGGARKLDLHGMTAQQAFHALGGFLRAAHADRVRCVEIVTGRGGGERGGVLRREFAQWLNLPDIRPLVLAAVHPHTSSAMHAHMANPGSVRLLLRRPRG